METVSAKQGVSEISDDGSTDGDPQGVSEQTAVMGDLGTEASHLLFAGMGTVCRLSQQRLQVCEGSHSRMRSRLAQGLWDQNNACY